MIGPVSAQPLWQSILLAAIGPLVAAIVGTLIVGLFAQRITRIAQQRREDHRYRELLISEMTQVASALYFETQRYWRARHREHLDGARLQELRAALDRQYHTSRVAAEVLEARLRIFFRANAPRLLWHSTIDLLTVRYFQVIGLATRPLREINAGPEHSFLTADELDNPKLVLDAYRQRLHDAAHAVLETELDRPQ
jgi:hypothetical protein